MRLYHGTGVEIRNGEVKYKFFSSQNKIVPAFDFGEGFYTNMFAQQAKNWATLRSHEVSGNAYFYNVDFNIDDRKGQKTTIYKFVKDIDWMLFVAYQRGPFVYELNKGKTNAPIPRFNFRILNNYKNIKRVFSEIENTADLIVGPIADDSLNDTINLFLKNFIGQKVAVHVIAHALLGTQFVFKSKESLDWINLSVPPVILDNAEKDKCMALIGQQREQIANDLTEVQKEYLRDANNIYFEELLQQKEKEFANFPENINLFERMPSEEELRSGFER